MLEVLGLGGSRRGKQGRDVMERYIARNCEGGISLSESRGRVEGGKFHAEICGGRM